MDNRIQGAKDFYFKVPEQKTACACLEVACNETKPQRIICSGKGQRGGVMWKSRQARLEGWQLQAGSGNGDGPSGNDDGPSSGKPPPPERTDRRVGGGLPGEI